MAVLINFTEGFEGQTVALHFRDASDSVLRDLRTDPRTGLARAVSLDADGRGTLECKVQGGGPAVLVELDTATLQFVSAEMRDGNILLTPVSKRDYAAEPRGYG